MSRCCVGARRVPEKKTLEIAASTEEGAADRARETLDASRQKQDDENQHEQAHPAARIVAPASTVRPRRNRADHHQDKDDEQYCCELLVTGAIHVPPAPAACACNEWAEPAPKRKAHGAQTRLRGRVAGLDAFHAGAARTQQKPLNIALSNSAGSLQFSFPVARWYPESAANSAVRRRSRARRRTAPTFTQEPLQANAPPGDR